MVYLFKARETFWSQISTQLELHQMASRMLQISWGKICRCSGNLIHAWQATSSVILQKAGHSRRFRLRLKCDS